MTNETTITATVANPVDAGTERLALATAAGAVAALAGAAIWALVTIITEYQIGWMAVGIGFLVGFAVRATGRSSHHLFGIVGALLAFAGCLCGNALSIIGFIAKDQGISFLSALQLVPFSAMPSLLTSTFDPMDLLFYGIAIYEGYKLSRLQAN